MRSIDDRIAFLAPFPRLFGKIGFSLMVRFGCLPCLLNIGDLLGIQSFRGLDGLLVECFELMFDLDGLLGKCFALTFEVPVPGGLGIFRFGYDTVFRAVEFGPTIFR